MRFPGNPSWGGQDTVNQTPIKKNDHCRNKQRFKIFPKEAIKYKEAGHTINDSTGTNMKRSPGKDPHQDAASKIAQIKNPVGYRIIKKVQGGAQK